jgi:hypothetical protein
MKPIPTPATRSDWSSLAKTMLIVDGIILLAALLAQQLSGHA